MNNQIRLTLIKSEDNYSNVFLADDDQVGDQIQASVILDDGTDLHAMQDNVKEAIAELRQKIKAHHHAKQHKANLAMSKAIGLHTFE